MSYADIPAAVHNIRNVKLPVELRALLKPRAHLAVQPARLRLAAHQCKVLNVFLILRQPTQLFFYADAAHGRHLAGHRELSVRTMRNAKHHVGADIKTSAMLPGKLPWRCVPWSISTLSVCWDAGIAFGNEGCRGCGIAAIA